MTLHREFEVRKLPPSVLFDVVRVLACDGSWKNVMALIRREPTATNPCHFKYTTEHIRMIEDAGNHVQQRCAEIFLQEWGTSGRKQPTLANLLDLLVEAQLYRAVEYVATQLLKESPPPRPTSGPAASVDTEEELRAVSPRVSTISPTFIPHCPSAPPESSQNSHPSVLEDTSILNSNTAVSTTSDLGQVDIHNEEDLQLDLHEESMRLAQLMETAPLDQSKQVNGYKLVTSPQHFTYKVLHKMTNSFDSRPVDDAGGRLLGTGAFGSVYLAVMEERQLAAVKMLHMDAVNLEVQFCNEVEALSRLRHPNLLPLIGYSCDGPNKCLVYQFMSQGNLQERLACKGSWKEPLSWEVRVKVGLGTARGLLHLHTAGTRPLVHRDVKSANILLDSDLTAKLGDFGLVRLGASGLETQSIAMTTTVFGTSAYMAPEAFRGDVSVKMDTFSFGVVILELLTALAPYDEAREGCDLVTHVFETCDDTIAPLLDPNAGGWILQNTGIDVSQELFGLAQGCLEEKRKRPTMISVVSKLEGLLP